MGDLLGQSALNGLKQYLGDGSIAQAALNAYQGNSGAWRSNNLSYAAYSGWTGPALREPAPKTYPESSAAAAGFAAGIKHALNVIMGPCKGDPEKAKLYEDLMAVAVKVVLAPEASDELSRRALFVYSGGWVVVVDMGESNPEEITLSGVKFYLTDRVSEECPMAVYRSR